MSALYDKVIQLSSKHQRASNAVNAPTILSQNKPTVNDTAVIPVHNDKSKALTPTPVPSTGSSRTLPFIYVRCYILKSKE